MELMDIYNQIQNPLDDDEVFFKILKEFTERDSQSSIYGAFKYDEGAKEPFPQSERDKQFLDYNHPFYDNIVEDFKKNNPNKRNMKREDIIELCAKPQEDVFDKRASNFFHVRSRKVKGIPKEQDDIKNVRHRFYINIEQKDVLNFANYFRKKCEERNLPYHFKFSNDYRFNDPIVIYSNTLNLGDYYEILNEIKKEHPEMNSNYKRPPLLTGVIDGWIGYAAEPQLEYLDPEVKAGFQKTPSYNQYVIAAMYKAIKDENKDFLARNKEKIVNNPTIRNQIIDNMYKYFLTYSYQSSEETKKEFIKVINSKLNDFIDEYIKTGKIDYRIEINNKRAHFTVDDFEHAITPIIVDTAKRIPSIKDKYIKRIKENVKRYHVDPDKICFVNEVVENMKKFDEWKVKKENKDNGQNISEKINGLSPEKKKEFANVDDAKKNEPVRQNPNRIIIEPNKKDPIDLEIEMLEKKVALQDQKIEELTKKIEGLAKYLEDRYKNIQEYKNKQENNKKTESNFGGR